MAAHNGILGHVRAGDTIDGVKHVAIDLRAVGSGRWAVYVNTAQYV